MLERQYRTLSKAVQYGHYLPMRKHTEVTRNKKKMVLIFNSSKLFFFFY